MRANFSEKNKRTQNYIRAIEFQNPECVPTVVSIMLATWIRYGEKVEEIVLNHPKLFPTYKKGGFKKMKLNRAYQKGKWKDVWGITWENIEDGLTSASVEVEAPLKNWEDFKNYPVPDPLLFDWFGEKIDWKGRRKGLENSKK